MVSEFRLCCFRGPQEYVSCPCGSDDRGDIILERRAGGRNAVQSRAVSKWVLLRWSGFRGLRRSPPAPPEIARMILVGTVALSEPLTSWVSETLRALECGTMEISHQIAIEAYSLPGNFHKDPADRILVATARIYDLTLVTMDERILQYSHVTSQDARL
jgi:hypothetical protein